MYKVIKKEKINKKDILEWGKLWLNSKNAQLFNSHQWFEACEKSMPSKYLCFFVYDNDELVSIIPVKVILHFIYVSPGGKYLDKNTNLFLKSNHECMDWLIKKYFRHKLLIFNEVPEKDLQYYGQDFITRESSINPYAILDSELSTITKRTLKKIKSILDVNKNKLSFKAYSGNNLKNNINLMFNIEKESNKIKRKKAIFIHPKVRQLFYELSSYPGTTLFVLYFEGKPIAHTFDFINKDYIMGYHTAYVNEYKNLIPGKLVSYFVMKYCLANNIYKYDFSRGDGHKKRQFARFSEKNYNLFYTDICVVKFFVKIYFSILDKYSRFKMIIKKIIRKK